MEVKKWYEQTWAAILLLIIFFPVGLFLMWKYSEWNKVLKIIITVICGIIFIGIINPNKSAKEVNTLESSVSVTTNETKAETSVPETTTAEVTTVAAVQAITYEAELSNGYFTAGIDFPAGKYDIEAISGSGNVSSSNLYSGGINAMMATEEKNISDLFEQSYQNIDLDEGVVLSISGVVIKISSKAASGEPLKQREQPNTEIIPLSNGNFTAGTDFVPGVYDIVAIDGSGNVSSSNIFDGGINAMMSTTEKNVMDMFQQEYKNITLESVDTLKIDGVSIELRPSK